MIVNAIKQLLLLQVPITTIIGDRIRVRALDAKELLPAMDIRVVASGNTEQSLDGNKPGFLSLVTIDCYSDSNHSQADTLARLLYSPAILGYRGTIGGCHIRGITADGAPTQDDETVDPASEKRRYVTTVDYEVSWG